MASARGGGGGGWRLRGHPENRVDQPTLGEWALGLWSSVGQAAAVSLTGFIVYALFYWIASGSVLIVGADLIGNPSVWGKGVSAALVIVTFLSVPAEVAKALAAKLYPAVPGTRTPFLALLADPVKLWLVAALAIGVVLVSVVLLEPGGTAFAAVLTAVLFYTSLPLSEIGKEKQLCAADRRAAESVRKLLEAAGYKAITSPTTGDPEVDPLLKEVDFLCYGGERVLAVVVKRGATGAKTSDWSIASPLLSAANILQERLAAKDGGLGLGVRPFLVLVGGAIADSLRTFGEREGVSLVHVPSDAVIHEVLGDPDPDALAERAAQLLSVPRISGTSNRASASV
ncbi:MAG: hypothetical protein ACREXS_02465 [Gammaproteobacteria bacterium]